VCVCLLWGTIGKKRVMVLCYGERSLVWLVGVLRSPCNDDAMRSLRVARNKPVRARSEGTGSAHKRNAVNHNYGCEPSPASPLGCASIFAVPERFKILLGAVSPDDVAARHPPRRVSASQDRARHVTPSRSRAIAPADGVQRL